jgi:cytochrome bd ubiquinol oxidase subunit II
MEASPMAIPFDYHTLRIIWWVLIGVLIISFAVTDGFDLGIGMLLHRVAKTENERRVVVNSIGPIWEGNQVWFILGGGALFAAWPEIYAVSFSGFYFAMLLVLLALILRPVGFKYRSKLSNPTWRATWDICIFIAGFVPTLLFGVAIGNVLLGVPFYFDDNIQSFYTGTLLQLLNPFGLLCGLLSIAMFIMHGAIFLTIKTSADIQKRAMNYATLGGILTMLLFALGGIYIAYFASGYVLVDQISLDAPSNPLHKKVALQLGAWITNYYHYPKFLIAPICGFLGALLAIILVKTNAFRLAWLSSAASITGIIATVGLSMFPFILPSSTQPDMSLLIWDASSSQLTLFIMLIASIIFIPLIVLYTSWVYYVMRGKITNEYIEQNKNNVY